MKPTNKVTVYPLLFEFWVFRGIQHLCLNAIMFKWQNFSISATCPNFDEIGSFGDKVFLNEMKYFWMVDYIPCSQATFAKSDWIFEILVLRLSLKIMLQNCHLN